MSTRCCVKVIKKFSDDKIAEVMIYHHCDGYPEGVGVDLVNRSKKWGTGWQFKQERSWNIDNVVNSLIKDENDRYEFTAYNHIDIEYLYTIDCDAKTIKCNEANWIFGEDENGEQVSRNEIGKEVKIPVGE